MIIECDCLEAIVLGFSVVALWVALWLCEFELGKNDAGVAGSRTHHKPKD